MAKSAKKFILIGIVFLVSVVLFSCNEDSNLSITSQLSTSRNKSDKTWRQANVVKNTEDEYKVDFVFLLANDGLHIVSENTKQKDNDSDVESSVNFLKEATIKNNSDVEGKVIKGLCRNVYIPSDYDSNGNVYIFLQTSESGVSEVDPQGDAMSHIYKVELKSVEDFDPSKVEVSAELEKADSMGTKGIFWVSRSLVPGSDLLLFREKEAEGDEYKYYIGKLRMEGEKLGFEEKANFSFDKDYPFWNFWENCDNDTLSAAVLYTTSGDEDRRKQEYYVVKKLDESADVSPAYLEGLKDYAIRNFIVYNDGEFMALTQSGSVMHSLSTKDHYFTNDSVFSYSRYTPLAIFYTDEIIGDDSKPEVVIFAKYSSSGFIIYGYNKDLDDNKRIYNSTENWGGQTVTSGFAINFRTEDISELMPVVIKEDGEISYRILVLSTENGLTTYTFNSLRPREMVSNGTYHDGFVYLWEEKDI